MEKIIINAQPRTVVGKQVRALRREGILPAVLYGPKMEPINISLEEHSSSLILGKMTASSLVTIELEGKEYPALVREKQRNFIKGNLLHVDFQVISMSEKLRTKVGVELIGEAPAVNEYMAILVNGLEELEVECFPTDLPERITVDVSSIVEIGDGIFVKDVVVSDKVELLDNMEEMIVLASSTYEEEEEEEELEVEEGLEEPDVIEKGKKEEDEEGEDSEESEEQ
ncbi:50S ribosomal protein L25 [Chloroflexota bacterium]